VIWPLSGWGIEARAARAVCTTVSIWTVPVSLLLPFAPTTL
jgi:hypothetical protein